MYRKFGLLSVNLEQIDRQVRISFSADIDEDSLSANSVRLTTKDGSVVDAKISAVGPDIILKLHEWPIGSYYLVMDASVSDIAGNTLGKPMRYEISFVSEITSKVIIKSPYNFEKLEKLMFKLDDTEKIGCYYAEIAKENAFYNVVYSGNFLGQAFSPEITGLEAGQYYVRFRCEKDGKQGIWSDTVTFIYKYICDDDVTEEDGPSANAEMPSAWDEMYSTRENASPAQGVSSNAAVPSIEVETELEILNAPENGETPAQFIFEFDKELDSLCGTSVIVIRKDF